MLKFSLFLLLSTLTLSSSPKVSKFQEIAAISKATSEIIEEQFANNDLTFDLIVICSIKQSINNWKIDKIVNGIRKNSPSEVKRIYVSKYSKIFLIFL